jgi:hypothetical protein
MKEIQGHIRRVRFVLGCFVLMTILTILLRLYYPKQMPGDILLLSILSEALGICLILWLLRRLKNKARMLGLSKG